MQILLGKIGRWMRCGLAAGFFCVTLVSNICTANEESPPPDETVRSLEIKLQIGASGEALEEPLALDLGLGFPLWLAPLGTKTDQSEAAAPFGAVPQQSTAKNKLEPGRNATFTYSTEGDAGQDPLRTTPQLLAGVRVLDISRIGFSSIGKTDWVLEGYEIQVNGRKLASASGLNQRVRAVQDDDRVALADVGLKISSLESEKADLEALAQAKLSAPADEERLKEVLKLLEPLLAKKAHVEARLAGIEPWYEDAKFQPAVSETASIGEMQVTVVTANHSEADTSNFAYFCAGGHKYALNPGGEPLTGAMFSQEFTLNSTSGPLTAADLRGWALGTLARGQHGGLAPDRWHPQRMLVKVDGRIVYDSEENTMDRDSLAAIRLVPPAHFAENGKLVVNEPAVREVFLWESGKGLGLDAATGKPLPLPEPDAPEYPESESTAGQAAPGTSLPAGTQAESPGMPPAGDDLAEGCEPLFPGEQPPIWEDPGFSDGWPPSGMGSDQAGGGPWPGTGQGSSPQSDGIGPWFLAWLWQWLSGSSAGGSQLPWPPGGLPTGPASGSGGLTTLPGTLLPPGNDPVPAGQPFQIGEDSVAVVSGCNQDDEFTIRWEVSGDESQIQGYDVSLVELYPDRAVPFGGTVLSAALPAGIHQYTGHFSKVPAADAYYVVPIVTAKPSDPNSLTLHQRIGPARAVFPSLSKQPLAPFVLSPFFNFMQTQTTVPGLAPVLVASPVSFSGPPSASGTAVWRAGKLDSHIAMFFDQASPGYNIVARRMPEDSGLAVRFDVVGLPVGKYRLVAHLGFLGPSEANAAEVSVLCRIDTPPPAVLIVPGTAPPAPPPPKVYTQKVSLSDAKTGPPEPMKLIEQEIEIEPNAAGKSDVLVEFTFAGGATDPLHPAVLYGVRLIPVGTLSQTVFSPNQAMETVMPDLVGDAIRAPYTATWNAGFAETEWVHYIEGDMIHFTVTNRGLAPTATPMTLGLVKYEGPAPSATEAIAPGKSPMKPDLPNPALMDKLAGGTGAGSAVPWIAKVDVPTLLTSKGNITVAIPLPPDDAGKLKTNVSDDRYRVMVDMTNTVKEGESISDAERNNWSGLFRLKRGPHIESFWIRSQRMVPGQPLELQAEVYGSKSWTVSFDYAGSKHVEFGENQPFVNTQKVFRKLQSPWPVGSDLLAHPKAKVTLTVWNSDKSIKAERSQEISLLDFNGTFRITEASTSYTNLGSERVHATVKVEYECTAPFAVGSYGDPMFGSVFVRAHLMNPKKMVTLLNMEPGYNKIILQNDAAEGVLAAGGHFCAIQEGEGKEVYWEPMHNFPQGELPAKGVLTMFFTLDCRSQTPPQCLVRWFDPGKWWIPYDPELRMEVVIHTTKQKIALLKTVPVLKTPAGAVVKLPFPEVAPPYDESKYLLGGEPAF